MRTPRQIDEQLLAHHRSELPDPLDPTAIDFWGDRGDWLRRRLAAPRSGSGRPQGEPPFRRTR